MAWIKMRTELGSAPAVIAIAANLGMDEFAVVGRLHALWSWADQHTTDGNATCVTENWIDRFLCAENFSKSLIEVGWLTRTKDGLRIPRFKEHNGESAKRRALTAKRAAKKRCAKSNATSVTKSAPREEKRKSNKNTPIAPLGGVDIPASLSQSDEFQRAWSEWVVYRKERGKKLVPSTAKAQLETLAGWGVPKSIRSIRRSIEQGWTGLFDPDADGPGGRSPPPLVANRVLSPEETRALMSGQRT